MKIVYSFIFLLLFAKTGFAQTLEDDRLALLAFYDAAGGKNWAHNSGWSNLPRNVGDNPCGWYGVTCDNARVTKLNLQNNLFGGVISPAIGNLTALTYLNLNGSGITEDEYQDFIVTNGLGGELPHELGNLTNLEYLDLGVQRFTGQIFNGLGNLVKLQYLDISFMAIDGAFEGPGKLINTIPVEIGNLVNLKYIDLSNQSLTGMLPASLGNLINLEYFNVNNNLFSGQIPSTFANFTKIKYLDLGYSIYSATREIKPGDLTGPMPDWSGIPPTAKINVQSQSLNFDGMEGNTSRLAYYAPQANLKINRWGAVLRTSSDPSGIYVDAGGNISNNTYRLFKDNILIETKTGDQYFKALEKGLYRIEVTNSMVPGLKLVSENYNVTSLPVTLSNFSAKKQSSGNFLTWQTTSETTNKGFEIERSKDAINFENIGFVDGNGDSNATNDYSFLDKNPFTVSYYRLKQIDYDGKFEYSRIIYVKKDNAVLSFYPNPAKDQLFVEGLEKEENITFYNIEGRKILDQKISSSQPVNTSTLSNGLYLIKVGKETGKLVIQN